MEITPTMNLLYKPDWDDTKERYKTWWAHEYFGRCALSVTAPKADPPAIDPPKIPDTVDGLWFDFEFRDAWNNYAMSLTFYGGEAFPVWHPGYPGWTCHSCFMGARVELDTSTGWIYPLIDQGELTDHDYNDLVVDRNNHWWLLTQEMLRIAASKSSGKCIPTIGAFGGCGDTLAALRGSDKLLIDLIDCPEYVRDFDQYLMKQWFEIYDTFYSIINQEAGGSTCWFELWSPGKFYAAQNDFAYMISPKMFREIFLPTIEMQTNFLDNSVYHVDGIGNFAHVDALCELPRLNAIQILPGEGKPSPLHYMDLLKKVQAAGKNLHINIPAHEVKDALDNLSARGLFIQTYCASEGEAKNLISQCEEWSVDR
ncbi:MAG: uroporphyrinogen decarboxylase/cobalamine-independent methonine synthase family protein [Armatimonadota bacterium]